MLYYILETSPLQQFNISAGDYFMYVGDEELANAVKGGSERAFEELVRLYGGLIRAIVKYHLKSVPMWAEDCENDVLLSVWRNIDRFDPEKNTLKNWLGAVAKYRAINYKRKYIRELSGKELTEDITDESTAEVEILKRETRSEILSLLEGLNDTDREIFIRRYIMEQPVEEIAAASQQKPSWIYNRLSRGRKILRIKWSDYREE